MSRSLLLVVTGMLFLGIPLVSWAEEAPGSVGSVDELLVELANTPPEHQAVADYFGTKADEHRKVAERHRKMGVRYSAKTPSKHVQRKHCDRIATLNEKIAAEYEALAKAERQEATN